MKIFISADMEGLTGVSAREEVTKGHDEYREAQTQMNLEVAAACEGAWAAGADTVYVKDAHWTGRNVEPSRLPVPQGKTLRVVRGWSGHPFSMVQELDDSFSAVLFIGYHSAANRGGNPLAHTLSSALLSSIQINEHTASEFLIFSYAASLVKVPVAFLAGDANLCTEARGLNETIHTVATFVGKGPSIVTEAPAPTIHRIRDGVTAALRTKAGRLLPLPSEFRTEVCFKNQTEAYRRSFYPGAKLKDDHTIQFETLDYFEVLRLLRFMTM